MRRRSRASSKPTKARSRKAKTVRHSGSSASSQKTEIARLTRELHEAQDQQRTTSEILGVVARSRTDLRSVLDTVCQSAAQLCEAYDAIIWRPDGDRLFPAAHHGPITQIESVPLVRGTVLGRSILEKRTVHVADVQTLVDEFPISSEYTRRLGYRTGLFVPLMREGVAIGVIALRRTEAQLFTERQVALLQTFADQAVIAIENVRLFEAEQQRTRELSESLEQQTATADVLRIISLSPSELSPVFQSILKNATQLCDAKFGTLSLRENETFRTVALHNAPLAFLKERQRDPVLRPSATSGLGRLAATKSVVHISDLRTEKAYSEGVPTTVVLADAAGARTLVLVPMLTENQLLGAIAIYRQEVRPFTDKQIELVQNFAAQAVPSRTRGCSTSCAKASTARLRHPRYLKS